MGNIAQCPCILRLKRRIHRNANEVFAQKTSPKHITLSLAVGAIFGIFPIPCTTLVLGVLAAYIFSLNKVISFFYKLSVIDTQTAIHNLKVAVLFANCLATPIELALIPVFSKLGVWVLADFGVEATDGSNSVAEAAQGVKAGVSNGDVGGLWKVFKLLYSAVVGWACFAPIGLALFMFMAKPHIERFMASASVTDVEHSSKLFVEEGKGDSTSGLSEANYAYDLEAKFRETNQVSLCRLTPVSSPRMRPRAASREALLDLSRELSGAYNVEYNLAAPRAPAIET